MNEQMSMENKFSDRLNSINDRFAFSKLIPYMGLIAIVVVFTILTDGKIIQPSNLKLILGQVYVLLIASTGVFLIMTVGGLDFSQGSILGFSSIIFCWVSQYNILLAIIAGILGGALMGLINGFFHVKFRLASFIVTHCTMYLFRGLCEYITTNGPVAAGPNVVSLNQTWLKATITIVILVIAYFLFRFTRLGIDLRAIGANENAARFAGIRPERTKFLVFLVAGALTGLAAFLNVIKVGSITGTAGTQLETQILISLVLGGMPINGGAKARFINVIIGVLSYSILGKSLPMVFSESSTQQLVQGFIFLAVVALTMDRKNLRVIK